MMRRGFGAGLSLLCGLAVLLLNVEAAEGADSDNPQITLSGSTPLRNGDTVILSGRNFTSYEILTGFGVVMRFEPQGVLSPEDSWIDYRGFNLEGLQVRADFQGQFRLPVPLTMLSGVRGQVELALFHQGHLLATEFLTVHDSGPLLYSSLDATAGTLIFDTYAKGGSGEPIVINGDDVPLSSNAQTNWSGTLFQVNLERYTTNDGTGTSTPNNNITNDVTFTGSPGDLTSGSSGIMAGLSGTYKSLRVTVLVWDVGNYGSITGTTTTGATQGEGWLSCADVTAPYVLSAVANSLTTILVTFSESVTTPSSLPNAIDNWTVTFNGNKAVSNMTPLGASTTTVTIVVANLGDRGATPQVDFTTGSNEYEDGAGNDCATSSVTASDGISPATPSITSPVTNTFLEDLTMNWAASAGSGTDNSLVGMVLQGSNTGSTFDSLGYDDSSPYSATYTFGVEYTFYRVKAYDNANNYAYSNLTENLQDAHHLHLTTIPPSTQANVESGQWTVTIHDNYGNPETVTQTISLSSTSATGVFHNTPGGPTVYYINLISTSAGNFYYLDTHTGTFWINVINAAFLDDSTQYTVTENTTIASIKIRTAAGGGGSETDAIEVAGAANGGSYNVSPWMYAAGYNSLDQFVQDVAANWAVTGTISGGAFENVNPSISNRYTANALSNQSGTATATYTSFSDATGTFTVDATRPATVTGFNISENQNQFYVNSSWSRTSSYDDGSNPASGNVEDFQIRYSASAINNETAWNNATIVPDVGKPLSFNLSGYWEIYMASVPAGLYYYAIKTMDPQGYWSSMGSGCYTTSPDYSLPVTLSSFQAQGGYGKITVTWSTESEVDAIGFRLLRDTEPGCPNAVLVSSYETNPELLCQGTSATGFDYAYVDLQDLLPETIYYYQLQTVDVSGQIQTAGQQASASPIPLPTEFALSQNYPNPFNPTTQFTVTIPRDSWVSVTIYDVQGREIARLLDNAYLEPSVYPLTWNGRDGSDTPVPSGLYLCRLHADKTQLTTKMILIK